MSTTTLWLLSMESTRGQQFQRQTRPCTRYLPNFFFSSAVGRFRDYNMAYERSSATLRSAGLPSHFPVSKGSILGCSWQASELARQNTKVAVDAIDNPTVVHLVIPALKRLSTGSAPVRQDDVQLPGDLRKEYRTRFL